MPGLKSGPISEAKATTEEVYAEGGVGQAWSEVRSVVNSRNGNRPAGQADISSDLNRIELFFDLHDSEKQCYSEPCSHLCSPLQ
jgi:hypothetical protein